jgi:hypothetical protein
VHRRLSVRRARDAAQLAPLPARGSVLRPFASYQIRGRQEGATPANLHRAAADLRAQYGQPYSRAWASAGFRAAMRSFLSASGSEASQPACTQVTRILHEILGRIAFLAPCSCTEHADMSGDCVERRFLVVELYAYSRLPAPAVVISEIVTASASVRTSGVFGTRPSGPRSAKRQRSESAICAYSCRTRSAVMPSRATSCAISSWTDSETSAAPIPTRILARPLREADGDADRRPGSGLPMSTSLLGDSRRSPRPNIDLEGRAFVVRCRPRPSPF